MGKLNPLLENILSLAKAETWQSREWSDENIRAWLYGLQELDVTRVYFVGCGTSLYAGQVGKYVIEKLARVPAEAVPGFAFATYIERALLSPQTLVVGISATGNTQATVDALAKARETGALTLALTADAKSGVAHNAGATILISGSLDVSVKTRTYVQTLAALYLLAARLGEASQRVTADVVDHWQAQLTRAAEASRHFLQNQMAEVEHLAQQYTEVPNVFVLGSGPNAGTAEEASLKIIEMAKMCSESQDLENFLHGRLREVDQATPVFFVAPHGPSSQRVLDFLTVTDYVGAPSVVLTDQESSEVQRLATHVVQLPGGLDELATPLLYITPLYLFAYHLASYRGYDPRSRRYPDIIPQNVRYGDTLGT
jgi:glucosamine--fructose-6-phosphate aminotransferase (isomerizing)